MGTGHPKQGLSLKIGDLWSPYSVSNFDAKLSLLAAAVCLQNGDKLTPVLSFSFWQENKLRHFPRERARNKINLIHSQRVHVSFTGALSKSVFHITGLQMLKLQAAIESV